MKKSEQTSLLQDDVGNDSEQGNEKDIQSNTPCSVFVTTFKSMVGSGFIGLPYAVKEAGIFGGIVVMLFVWLFTSITMKQLIWSAQKVKENNPSLPEDRIDYGAIGTASYQNVGKIACIIPVILTQFLAGCGFMIFIGSTVSSVIPSTVYSVEQISVTTITTLILLQIILAMAPTPAFLVGVANVGNVAFVAAMLFALYHGITQSPPSMENAILFNSTEGLYICFGIACFTFSAHAQCVSIYGTAGPRARASYICTIDLVLLAAAIAYISFAVFNYLCYGSTTDSIIFQNLGDSVANVIVKISMSFMLICNFPLSVFPVHQSIELALGLRETLPPKMDSEDEIMTHIENQKHKLAKFDNQWSTRIGPLVIHLTLMQILSRIFVITGAGLIAIFAEKSFGFMLAIAGGFNGVMAFVNPPLMHSKISGGWSKIPWHEGLMNVILVLCGTVGGAGSLFKGFQGLLKVRSDS